MKRAANQDHREITRISTIYKYGIQITVNPMVTFCSFVYVQEPNNSLSALRFEVGMDWLHVANNELQHCQFRVSHFTSSSCLVVGLSTSLSLDLVCFKLASVDNRVASSFIVNVLFFARWWNGNKRTTMERHSDVIVRLIRIKWMTINGSRGMHREMQLSTHKSVIDNIC